jgi:hypothetical protein
MDEQRLQSHETLPEHAETLGQAPVQLVERSPMRRPAANREVGRGEIRRRRR